MTLRIDNTFFTTPDPDRVIVLVFLNNIELDINISVYYVRLMSYQKVHYSDVEPVSGAMHFLREPLESQQIGVTMVRCEPDWRNMKHDHEDNQHEEVYVLLEGAATITIDGEDVSMRPGEAIRISPEATRQIENGDAESAFLLISAPAPLESTDERTEWRLDGFVG